MTPSVDVRIGSMLRVLRNLVLPDLRDGLAIEAANLVVGHLEVLRGQIDHIGEFEALEFKALQDLAIALAAHARTEPELQIDAARLAANAALPRPERPADMQERSNDLNAAIIALLERARETGHSGREPARLVLKHGLETANRHRSWFAGMGFDGSDSVPSIPDMLANARA